MGGRKGRNGLFPASACIKLSGTYCKHILQQLFIVTCQLFKVVVSRFLDIILESLFLESSFCVGVHALFPLAVALIFLTVANQWLFP